MARAILSWRKHVRVFPALLAALSIWACPFARAEPSVVPRTDFWLPDGIVHAILETNGVVYLGGAFSTLGRPDTPALAALDRYSGSPDPNLARFNGTVHAILDDGRGGWFIGGRFTTVGGLLRSNLTHIRADRSLDPDWNSAPDGPVLALAESGGVLYVGGSFTHLGGEPRNYAAAFDSLTGALLGWNPDVSVASIKPQPVGVRALALANGVVYVAGAFDSIGGVPRQNLAALDPVTGGATDWDPIPFSFPENSQAIDAMAVFQNIVYVGGTGIRSIGGVPRTSLAAFDTMVATNCLTAWNPEVDGPVYALALRCDTAYIAGSFSRVGGATRSNLAALDLEMGRVRAWNPSADGIVKALVLAGNVAYVGGDFLSVGGLPRQRIAGLDLFSGAPTAWGPAPGFSVSALTVSGNAVLAGGNPAGIIRKNLAALNARTGKPMDWAPDPNGAVYALGFSDSTLYAGGDFTEIGGQPRNRLAALNAQTGSATAWNPDVNGFERTRAVVESVVVSGNTVYVAGSFTNIGSRVRRHVAALNARTGEVLPWNPDANEDVRCLKASGNTIYAAGRFTRIGGETRRRVAALDAKSGAATDWNPTANDSVRWLEIRGETIFAGGLFSTIGAGPREQLAALDRWRGRATDWNPGVDSTNFIGNFRRTSYLNTFAGGGDAIYVGGLFNRCAGQARANLAAVDAQTGVATGWNPGADCPVIALAVSGDTIFAGGAFRTIGGQAQSYFAVFPPAGSPRITHQPRDQRVGEGASASFSVEAVGVEPLFYQWQVNGTNIAGATGSGLTIPSVQVTDSGNYSVSISNRLGLVNSGEAVLTVFRPVIITGQPQGVTVAPGTTVVLRVSVRGHPQPLFQWRLNGVNIPGAVAATLTLANAQPTDGGNYSVVMDNGAGAISSEVAVVVVDSPLLSLADSFEDRTILNSPSGMGRGNNVAATKEPGEPDHAGKPGGKSVWLSWRAPGNGVAIFSTKGSGFDTLLAVYTNQTVSGTGAVAWDEDRGGYLTSLLLFNAVAGTEYQIAIDGFAGGSGNIVLNWRLETTTNEIPRFVVQPESWTVGWGGSHSFYARAVGQEPLRYQWYHHCLPIPGATDETLTLANVKGQDLGLYFVQVSNPGGTIDSLPAFLEIGPLAQVQSQDKLEDLVGAAPPSPAERAANRQSAAEAGLLSSGFLSVAMGSVDSQILNNSGATSQPGEPNHCGVLGGASKWLDLLPEGSGSLGIDTIGSVIDTVLAVYRSTNLIYLSTALVACDNNGAPDGIRSAVLFEATGGTHYLVVVDGVNGAQGTININWKLGRPPVLSGLPPSHPVVRRGGSITLWANATSGIPPSTYQWFLNGNAIPGATHGALVLPNVQAALAGTYTVMLRNFSGVVLETNAVLTVASPLQLLSLGLTTNGFFRLSVDGDAGQAFVLQGATNLTHLGGAGWAPLLTNRITDGPIYFVDTDAPSLRQRFYRAITQP